MKKSLIIILSTLLYVSISVGFSTLVQVFQHQFSINFEYYPYYFSLIAVALVFAGITCILIWIFNKLSDSKPAFIVTGVLGVALLFAPFIPAFRVILQPQTYLLISASFVLVCSLKGWFKK